VIKSIDMTRQDHLSDEYKYTAKNLYDKHKHEINNNVHQHFNIHEN